MFNLALKNIFMWIDEEDFEFEPTIENDIIGEHTGLWYCWKGGVLSIVAAEKL